MMSLSKAPFTVSKLHRTPRRSAKRGAQVEPLEDRTLFTLAAKVVGYFPDYEYGTFSRIDFTALSQVNYFSITAASNGTLNTSGIHLNQLDNVVTAAHTAGATAYITLDPGTPYNAIATNPTALTAFGNNLITFCTSHNLNGIDIDDEPQNYTSTDQTDFGLMVSSLHPLMSSHGLSISAAVQVSNRIIPVADIPDVDSVLAMDYDLEYNSSAPYSESMPYLNNWANYGVPKSKLFMGVPFYGRTGSSWSTSVAATYADIIANYKSASGSYPSPDLDSAGGYGYNGVTTLQKKAHDVLQNGYAGIMIWEIGQDHFDSAGHYDQYSLLPAVKSALSVNWMTASAGASYTFTGNTPSLVINSGTVTFPGDVSSSVANLNVTVGSGASLILGSAQHLGSLTINGGRVSFAATGGVSALNSLTITNSGTLDMENNNLIVHNGNYGQISSAISQGLNLANDGYWNGNGITSSTAAGLSDTGLGALANNNGNGGVLLSTFEGVPVNNTDVLVKYTYFGDADFSGRIDGDDYTRIDTGFNSGQTGWRNGDFNDDGVINGDDYTLIDNAFNAQGPAISPMVVTHAVAAAIPLAHPGVAPISQPATARSSGIDEMPASSWIDDLLNNAVGKQ